MSVGDLTPWASQGLDPEIADPDTLLEYESEIVICRRAFSTAQAWLGSFSHTVDTYENQQCSWHGTAVDINQGSFAVVQAGSELEDLVGEVVRVSLVTGARSVFAYVVAISSAIVVPISLAQRCFLGIGLWAQPPEGVATRVEVMA